MNWEDNDLIMKMLLTDQGKKSPKENYQDHSFSVTHFHLMKKNVS